MARTDITATLLPGPYAHAGALLTMTAADTTDQNAVVLYKGDILVAHNTDASAHTVTVTSSADPLGRTKDITAESIAAGAIRVFGAFNLPGWKQSDARLYFEANDATVYFGVIRGGG